MSLRILDVCRSVKTESLAIATCAPSIKCGLNIDFASTY